MAETVKLSRRFKLGLLFLALLPVWCLLSQAFSEPPGPVQYWWCAGCQHELPFETEETGNLKNCPRCKEGQMHAYTLPGPPITALDLFVRVLIGAVSLLALAMLLLYGEASKMETATRTRWCECKCGHRIEFRARPRIKYTICPVCGAQVELKGRRSARPTDPSKEVSEVNAWLQDLDFRPRPKK